MGERSPRGLGPGSAGSFIQGVRVLAAVLALFAVIFLMAAIAGMVTGRPGERAGWVVRALALVCFVAAVVLNAAAR